MACSSACVFAAQVYRGRWFTIFASFMIMAAAGATYVFGIYSQDIKTTLGYDQETLNTLGFFKDLGANLGIISGLINEIAPEWVVLVAGAAMNFAGYFMIYLVLIGRVRNPKVWHMALYIGVGANSQGFTNTGCLVPAVNNFPESRGFVLGLLKGFVGVSGAIFTQLYHAIYGDDSKTLVLLIAWLPAVIAVASVHCIRVIDGPRRSRPADEFRVFCHFLYISIVLAAYILVVTIIQHTLSFSREAYIASAVVVVVLVVSPIAIVVREERHLWKETRKPQETIPIELPPPATAPPPPPEKKPAGKSYFSDVFNPPKRGENYSILQAVLSIDMIMIFTSTVIGTGGTLAAIDNMGQIGAALGFDQKSINTFVSMNSIWNYAGRVAAGFLSEIFIKKYKFPRPLMLSIVLFFSCTGFILIAFPSPGGIYASTVILGFTFGAQMPLFLAIISELFGLKHYSTLFNVGVLSSPVGSYFFNVLVAGRLYDREAERQSGGRRRAAGQALTCMGVECYRRSFMIITAATFVAGVVMLFLTCRTKQFYDSDIYAKYKEEEPAEEKAAVIEGAGSGEDRKEEEEP